MIELPELTQWQLAAIRAGIAQDMRRQPKRRPIDGLLQALRSKRPDAYRCHPKDPHKWLARCPSCAQRMGIIEQPRGKWPVTLLCVGGCDEQTILHALATDPGDSEHIAMLDAQVGVLEYEFARRDRARHARREIQTWQSTTTPSPNTGSMTSNPSEQPRRPGPGPNSPPTTPGSG